MAALAQLMAQRSALAQLNDLDAHRRSVRQIDGQIKSMLGAYLDLLAACEDEEDAAALEASLEELLTELQATYDALPSAQRAVARRVFGTLLRMEAIA